MPPWHSIGTRVLFSRMLSRRWSSSLQNWRQGERGCVEEGAKSSVHAGLERNNCSLFLRLCLLSSKTPKSSETGRLLRRKEISTLLLQWFIRGWQTLLSVVAWPKSLPVPLRRCHSSIVAKQICKWCQFQDYAASKYCMSSLETLHRRENCISGDEGRAVTCINPPGSIRGGALHLPETDSALALLRSATRFGEQFFWFISRDNNILSVFFQSKTLVQSIGLYSA